VRAITAGSGAIHHRQESQSAEHRAIGGQRRAVFLYMSVFLNLGVHIGHTEDNTIRQAS